MSLASRRPELVLVAVTLLWGSTFIITKGLLREVPPLAYLTVRFCLAAAALFALFPRAARPSRRALTAGAVLALGQTAGLTAQVLGQLYTTASKSSFVTTLSSALTPLVALLLYGERPRPQQLAGLGLATVGLLALTWPGARTTWNRGDLLSLGSAVLYAWVIVETSWRSRAQDTAVVATLQTGLAALLLLALLAGSHLLLWLLPSGQAPALVRLEAAPLHLSARVALAITYMALVCTVVTFLAQTWAMSRMSATQAAVLFALEPLFATALAIAVEGEAEWPGARGGVGALLIVAGLLVAEVRLREVPSHA